MDTAKILIVEDEAIIVAELRILIERFGYRALAPVSTGEAAVESALRDRPDLILMDIRLAGAMDGIYAAGKIRAEIDIPVIYLTANADDATIARARATGPSGYIYKPVNDRELYSNIDTALYRHRMETRLRESELRYRLLAENSSDVIWTMSLDGRFTYVSPSVTALTGWTPEEAMGIPLEKYLLPGYAEEMGAEILKELAMPPGQRPPHRTVQVRQYAKDGAALDIEVTTSWLTDERGNIIGLQGATRDIRERVRAEKELRERDWQLRSIIEHSVELHYMHDTEHRFMYVSPQSLSMLGYTPPEMMRKWTDFVTDNPENREAFLLVEEAIRTGERGRPYELEVFHKNGDRVWLEINESPVKDRQGSLTGIAGAARDITERKRALEKENRITRERDELFERLKLIMERMPLGCVLHDANFNVSFWNDAAERIFGFTREDVLGRSPYDVYIPPRAHEQVREIQRRMRGGDMAAHHANENITKDGRIIHCEWHNTPLLDSSGTFVGYLGMVQDITERRRAEQALAWSLERYRRVVETSLEGIWMMDAERMTTFVNPRMADMLGYSVEEMIGGQVDSFMDPADLADHAGKMDRRRRGANEIYERRFIGKDGRAVHMRVSARALMDAKGEFLGSFGMFTDITALKLAESQRETAREVLRDSEERYGELVQSANSIILRLDPAGRVMFINPYAEKFFGYSGEELRGRSVVGTIVPETDSAGRDLAAMFADILENSSRYERNENENTRRGGERVWIAWTNKALLDARGGLSELLCVGNDITDRKRAEQMLEWEAMFNATMAEMTGVLIPLESIDEISSVILDYARRMTGSAFGYAGYIDPATGFLVCPTMSGDIWERCGVADKSVVFERFGGLWGWVLDHRETLLTNSPGTDPRSSGTPAGHVPITRFLSAPALSGDTVAGQISLANAGRDYTDRDRIIVERLAAIFTITLQRYWTARALRASEDRYRKYVENAPLGVFVVDGNGRYIEANPAACRLTGYMREELLSLSIPELLAPESRDSGVMNFIGLKEKGSGAGWFAFMRKDGSRIYMTVDAVQLAEDAYIGFSTDITERRRAEEEVAKLFQAVEQSPTAIMITDAAGTIEYVNPGFTEITGYGPDEVRGKNPRILKSGHTSPDEYRELWMTILSGGTWQGTFRNRKKNGDLFWESAIISPVKGASGIITHLVAIKEDITERRYMEDALRESERRYRETLDNVQLCAVALDMSWTVVYSNDHFLNLTGWAHEEIEGKNYFDLFIPAEEGVYEIFRESLTKGSMPPHFENNILTRAGEKRLVRWSNTLLRDSSGEVNGVVSIGEDITDRKRAEEGLVASLREKEIMLKEIHHRVKNNFQVIISMLNLQERTIKSDEVKGYFADSRNRIRSMALIHEKLYQSRDLSRIDFGSYIRSLAGELYKSSVAAGRVPPPVIECEPVHLTIEQAIPCGLVINELLTNAIKYAFPAGFPGKGEVRVSMRGDSGGMIELTVADNGVGLPDGVDLSKTHSLGLSLVPLLVKQVDGSIELHREGGTSYTIRFKGR